MRRRLVVALAAVLSFPSLLPAQVDTSARIMGTAKSSFNGRPLSGVMISVPNARKFVVTDAQGTFLLGGLPVGRQKVLVAYNGRETEENWFELSPEKTKRLAILLDVDAVDLDPVVVSVQHRDDWHNLAGFYERRRFYGGRGRFWTEEDIRRERVRSINDLLRRMGINTGGSGPTKMTYGERCGVSVAVNGFPSYANEYEMVLLDDIRGVEWYGGFLGGGIPLAPGLVQQTRVRDSYMRAGRLVNPTDPLDPLERYEPPVRQCPYQALAIWTR